MYKFVRRKGSKQAFVKQSEGGISSKDRKKYELDRDDDEERRGIYTRTSQEVVSACAAICNALRFA